MKGGPRLSAARLEYRCHTKKGRKVKSRGGDSTEMRIGILSAKSETGKGKGRKR